MILRVKKNSRYFVASNEPFNDERLSWEARGVMGYLLSKPDNWELRNRDLIARGPAGEKKIERILGELQKFGYLHRRRIHDGQRFEWVSIICESPDLKPDSEAIPSKQGDCNGAIPPKQGDCEHVCAIPPFQSDTFQSDSFQSDSSGGDIVNTYPTSTDLSSTEKENTESIIHHHAPDETKNGEPDQADSDDDDEGVVSSSGFFGDYWRWIDEPVRSRLLRQHAENAYYIATVEALHEARRFPKWVKEPVAWLISHIQAGTTPKPEKTERHENGLSKQEIAQQFANW